jgi:Protein of unknown function (DUF3455)
MTQGLTPTPSLARSATQTAALTATLALSAWALSACGAMQATQGMKPMFSQQALPAVVQVPAGHKVALETVAYGEISYECRAKPGAAGQAEWFFVGPVATLMDREGRQVGRYFGPPATWVAADGSAVTGAQLAVAPGAAGAIPLQLVKANPAYLPGSLQGTSHIQRVATQGGVAPAAACTTGMLGKREVVKYQADYIFWKAM